MSCFPANEMVVITAKGNPFGVRELGDLAKPGVRIARVTGEKRSRNRPYRRIPEACRRARGKPKLAQQIADKAPDRSDQAGYRA